MLSSAALVQNAVRDRRNRGERGSAALKVLASGDGWRIADIVCTADAGDRPFEEVHAFASIAVVTAGAFSYRGSRGKAHLHAGAILLGNAGAPFCCGHEHGAGDRCIAFQMEPALLEALSSLYGEGSRRGFPVPAIPADRSIVDLVAIAELFASGACDVDPAELLAHVVARVLQPSARPGGSVSPASVRRALDVVRAIEDGPTADWTLAKMGRLAGMNQFHFLRCFRKVCGITPHAFVRQARLREAARLLVQNDNTIARVAAEAGFGDLSTFNHAFRRAFGCQPGRFRSRFKSR